MQVKLNGWQLSTLVLGSLFAGSLCTHGQFSRVAEAAPADVKGSPNIAVDTYRNNKGSYILYSDGRIVDAKGGNTDLGHPYVQPPATAKIGQSESVRGKSTGSPNVAVKALVRTDGSYILFSDGSIKKPNNADAGYASTNGSRVIGGAMGMAGVVDNGNGPVNLGEVGQEYSFELDGSIKLDNPVGPKSEAFLMVYNPYTPAESNVLPGLKVVAFQRGQISSDGYRVTFPNASGASFAPGGPGVVSSNSHFVIYDKS
jgi:hypothetical protein